MASFNGNKIKDTYQGIIKTIDNNTATGVLKELTDGHGNALGVHLNTAGSMLIEGSIEAQGIIDSSGGNKISFFFADQTSFPDASIYHGAVAHSHADGKMYFAHAGAWVAIANEEEPEAFNVPAFVPSGGTLVALNNSLNVFTHAVTSTLELPTAPAEGDTVKVSNRSTIDTNIITRAGSLIMGLDEDMTLNNQIAAFEMVYAGGTQGWIILGSAV